jgi:hypothetical protein
MAKGRQAASSAEKSRGGIQAEIENYKPLSSEDYDKGITMPDGPSKKAMEEIKKGKTVWFT